MARRRFAGVTAWGLDSDPAGDWQRWALCRHNPDLWSSDDPGDIASARHLCLDQCPVLAECQDEAQLTPPHRRRSIVWAGVRYDESGKPAKAQPAIPQPVLVQRACRHCGGMFETDRPARQYCGPACQSQARKERRVERLRRCA